MASEPKDTLSIEDSDLFYQLFFPLLDFVNQKYKVAPQLKKITGASALDPAAVKKVADRLWSEPELIDEYLSKNPSLPEDHREILKSWKKCRKDVYFLERHLKSGSILISSEDEQVYKAIGIKSSWEELLWLIDLPVLLQVTLIPFRNSIISDGLFCRHNIYFGGNIKKQMKDIYIQAKKNGEVHTTL